MPNKSNRTTSDRSLCEDRALLVAIATGAACGFCALTWNSKTGVGQIGLNANHPTAQRQGIAGRLIPSHSNACGSPRLGRAAAKFGRYGMIEVTQRTRRFACLGSDPHLVGSNRRGMGITPPAKRLCSPSKSCMASFADFGEPAASLGPRPPRSIRAWRSLQLALDGLIEPSEAGKADPRMRSRQ
jgi:hypothetical protein